MRYCSFATEFFFSICYGLRREGEDKKGGLAGNKKRYVVKENREEMAL